MHDYLRWLKWKWGLCDHISSASSSCVWNVCCIFFLDCLISKEDFLCVFLVWLFSCLLSRMSGCNFAFQLSLPSFPSWPPPPGCRGRDTWTTSCLDWFQGELEWVLTAWVAFPCCLLETNWSLMAAVLFLDMEPTKFKGVAVCSDAPSTKKADKATIWHLVLHLKKSPLARFCTSASSHL